MKYDYEISPSDNEDNYFTSKSTSIDILVETDGYLLYMCINAQILKYEYGEREGGIRKTFSFEKEFEFTGKWRIINNDSDSKDIKMFVQIKHEYIKHINKSYISVERIVGLFGFLRRSKEVTVWENDGEEECTSLIWVNADEFEFKSLFENKPQLIIPDIAILIGNYNEIPKWYKVKGNANPDSILNHHIIGYAQVVYNITTDTLIKDRNGNYDMYEEKKNVIKELEYSTKEDLQELIKQFNKSKR